MNSQACFSSLRCNSLTLKPLVKAKLRAMHFVLPRGSRGHSSIVSSTLNSRDFLSLSCRNLKHDLFTQLPCNRQLYSTQLSSRRSFLQTRVFYAVSFVAVAGGLGVPLGFAYLLYQNEHFAALIKREAGGYRKRTLRARKVSVKKAPINPPKVSARRKRRTLLSFQFWLRVMEIGLLFAPVVLFSPFLLLSFKEFHFQTLWNKLLVKTLELGGPMFVKLGQWASTRSDLFGPSVRSALSVLHSTVQREHFSCTIKTVKNALLIKDINEFFLEFDEDPIGCGVMAQVHKAVLENGIPVVVKVRRYKVRQRIERDLLVLNTLAEFIVDLIPKTAQPFSILNACAQFSRLMRSQLDLTTEYQNLELFSLNFSSNTKVDFPTPIYSSHDGAVLMESFQEGALLSDLFEEAKRKTDGSCLLHSEAIRQQVARLALNSFLQMVLVDNFCHSDMHPGNMVVRYSLGDQEIGSESSFVFDGLTFLDAGLVTQLSVKDQANFLDLFTAVATGDGRQAGQLMIERSDPKVLVSTPEEQALFIEGIHDVVSRVQKTTFNLQKVHIGLVLQDVLTLVYKYQVPIDPNFSSLVLSLVVAEGVMRQLDPNLDIFAQAMPFLLLANPEYKRAVIHKISEYLYTGDLYSLFSY